MTYKISTFKEVVTQCQKIIERNYSKEPMSIDGLPTGFDRLDQNYCINGLMKGDVISILGPASMGKTTFAINLIYNAVLKGKEEALREGMLHEEMLRVAYFSLDKKSAHVMGAMVSYIAQIDGHQLRTGYLNVDEKTKLAKLWEKISHIPFYFVEGLLTFEELEENISEMNIHGVGLVVIDSINGIYSSDAEVLKKLRVFKEIAVKFEIPIVLTNTLSLKLDNWQTIRKELEQGVDVLNQEIIKISDVVGILHRDEYYAPTDSNRGHAKLWVVKNKNGNETCIDLKFNKEILKFSELKENDS